jgi:hypothetical protein
MPVYANPLNCRLRSLIAYCNYFTIAIRVTGKYNLASPLVNMQVLLFKLIYPKDNIYLLS